MREMQTQSLAASPYRLIALRLIGMLIIALIMVLLACDSGQRRPPAFGQGLTTRGLTAQFYPPQSTQFLPQAGGSRNVAEFPYFPAGHCVPCDAEGNPLYSYDPSNPYSRPGLPHYPVQNQNRGGSLLGGGSIGGSLLGSFRGGFGIGIGGHGHIRPPYAYPDGTSIYHHPDASSRAHYDSNPHLIVKQHLEEAVDAYAMAEEAEKKAAAASSSEEKEKYAKETRTHLDKVNEAHKKAIAAIENLPPEDQDTIIDLLEQGNLSFEDEVINSHYLQETLADRKLHRETYYRDTPWKNILIDWNATGYGVAEGLEGGIYRIIHGIVHAARGTVEAWAHAANHLGYLGRGWEGSGDYYNSQYSTIQPECC